MLYYNVTKCNSSNFYFLEHLSSLKEHIESINSQELLYEDVNLINDTAIASLVFSSLSILFLIFSLCCVGSDAHYENIIIDVQMYCCGIIMFYFIFICIFFFI